MTKQQFSNELLNQIKKESNGCDLFDGRVQGDIETHVGTQLTIKDYYKIEDYHVVIFDEDDEHFFFSGGRLKSILNKYEQDLRGLRVVPQSMIKTASKRDYRPYTVV